MNHDLSTAFILGAGLGTRLRPLTDRCPKPLLNVCGKPIITYAMDHLIGVGIRRFIVNTHHLPEHYNRAFPGGDWRGIPITFRHEPVLLDTAGGLKNIEDLVGGCSDILVYNGDIISTLPLTELISSHFSNRSEVTLALRSRGPVQNVALDASGDICDIRNLLGVSGVSCAQFTGIYLVKRRFLDRLEPGRMESVVPVFSRMIKEQARSVSGVIIDKGLWFDIGSIDEFEKVNGSRLLGHEAN